MVHTFAVSIRKISYKEKPEQISVRFPVYANPFEITKRIPRILQ